MLKRFKNFLVSLISSLLLFSFYLTYSLIHPKRRRFEDVVDNESNRGYFDKNWYTNLEKTEKSFKSKFGYRLHYVEILAPRKSNKTVILVHGYSYNLVGSIKYADIFLKRGYNVIMYDHTNSGNSGGNFTTMGYREVQDLSRLVKKLRRENKNVQIGIHGESMGAATALIYTEFDPNLLFVISDCSYSSLSDLSMYQIRLRLNLPGYPFTKASSLFCRLIAGFYFEDIEPIKSILTENSMKIPILFIHGGDDHFTPTNMSIDMHRKRKDNCELFIAEEAGHAKSYVANKKRYIAQIDKFFEQYVD